jgi:hypothetical protein
MLKNVTIIGFVLAAFLPALLGGCGGVPTCPVAAGGGLVLDGTREVVAGQNWQEGLVDTRSERWARYNMIRDMDDRMFQDDLDMILLLDRQSSLTFWHPSVGR